MRIVALFGGGKRVGMIMAVGLVLCWLSLATATNTVFGRKAPALASVLGWSGSNSRATEAANLLSADSSPASLARAEALARRSLHRELLNSRAAATLASVAALQGDRTRADRMFRYTETITRRDLPTQFWLLQAAVERGDIEGALLHYDRAMSVSPPSWNTLVPVLATAASEPAVAHAIAPRIKRRPNWWSAFIDRLISTGDAPATSLPIILPALQFSPRDKVDLPFLVRGIEKLVEAGAYDDAWALYRRSTGAPAGARQGLRNGGFEAATPVAPFDWRLVEGEGLFATVQRREDGAAGNALYLSAEAGRTGDVAQQLLLLRPGRYTLSGTIGGSALESDGPEVLVTCVGAKAPVAQITLPAPDQEGRRFVATVGIPAGACPAQWLSIRLRASLDTAAPEVWIDSLSMRRG